MTADEFFNKYVGKQFKFIKPKTLQYVIGTPIGFSDKSVIMSVDISRPGSKYKAHELIAVLPENLLPTEPVIAVDINNYPHKCPNCKAPAFIGFMSIDCSAKCGGKQ